MGKAVVAVIVLLMSSLAYGQKRVEAGVLLDYTSISQTDTPNVGFGARLGVRAHRHLMLEGEFAYDYGVNFKELYVDVSNGDVKAVAQTSIGVTSGLFGPMLQPAHGHLRPFVTLKGGFMDFRLSGSLLPYSGIVSSVLGLRTSSLNPALYPGGGFQATLGPVGLRLEAGDAMYFNHGTHNNLRITFGPVVRF